MDIWNGWLKPAVRDALAFVADVLLPERCGACGREGSALCGACAARLAPLPCLQRCGLCGQPSVLGQTHPGCVRPHGPDGLFAALPYADSGVARAVQQGKYHLQPNVVRALAAAAAEKIGRDFPELLEVDALVPVPLHVRRERWRGFNQAAVACEVLAKGAAVPVEPILERRARTKIQKELARAERFANIRGAFVLAEGAAAAGRRFLVVDDVATTGATLAECARVLKRAGAAEVWCLALARE